MSLDTAYGAETHEPMGFVSQDTAYGAETHGPMGFVSVGTRCVRLQ